MAELVAVFIFLLIAAWIKSHDDKKENERIEKEKRETMEFCKSIGYVYSEDGHILGHDSCADAVEKERQKWERIKELAKAKGRNL